MSGQQRLVLYVMQNNRMNQAQAIEWLNTHCPYWKDGEPPRVRVVEIDPPGDD